MVSDFRKKKYLHVFKSFFDVDGNGTVERQDFLIANHNLAQLRGYKPGDVTYELMKELLHSIWDGLIAQADKDGSGNISTDEWVQLWDDYAKDPSKGAEWQQLYCKAIFQMLDASLDGSIDADEYATVFKSFGRDEAKSKEAFTKLSGGKPTISQAEFEKLWTEFYTSENPSDAGNYIFGELE
ncbi:juvenile hormone diol kinase [Phthorimaea operculella]|nr:juvenile hormone diol kinase [Phthorimaea operculella]